MNGKYCCEFQIIMKSGASDLVFVRSCKTKKAAESLSDWIHAQYAKATPSELLTLALPCQSKNQATRKISIHPQDICAISTVVSAYVEDSNEGVFKIEPGFRDTSSDPGCPFAPAIEVETRVARNDDR